MKTDDIYIKYTESLKNLENDSSIFLNFKSSPYFTDILEHTDVNFGQQYLNLIRQEFKEDQKNFLDIITLNDSIGNPVKYDFDGIIMSSSNLRYIYHALLIQSKCKNWFTDKKALRIVEIGGGYGGLCLYIKHIFKDFDVDYTILDLPEPSKLQNKFILETKVDNVRSISGLNLESVEHEKFDLVISNYCISEIGRANQEEYFNKLVVNCNKKFFIWNYLTRLRKFFLFKTFDIDFIKKEDYIFETERPLTGEYNKFIYSK
jgi:putative sugar O-methyltransferase